MPKLIPLVPFLLIDFGDDDDSLSLVLIVMFLLLLVSDWLEALIILGDDCLFYDLFLIRRTLLGSRNCFSAALLCWINNFSIGDCRSRSIRSVSHDLAEKDNLMKVENAHVLFIRLCQTKTLPNQSISTWVMKEIIINIKYNSQSISDNEL